MNDGGPAFPAVEHEFPNGIRVDGGMTLRDWFAGMVVSSGIVTEDGRAVSPQGVAQWAYGVADAMLAERSKK